MSFHPHTGGTYSGFTTLPMTTLDTILDSIVADVATAVAAGTANGWSVYDDQRTLAAHGGGYASPVSISGHTRNTATGPTVTNGSANVQGLTKRAAIHWIPGVTEITIPSVNYAWDDPARLQAWHTVNTITNDTTQTLASAWTLASQNNSKTVLEKVAGYIVLKCVSAQKTFYVQLIRPRSWADALRIRVMENWVLASHCPGPSAAAPVCSSPEIMRAYRTRQASGAAQVQYCLFLLPDSLGLWTSGNPAAGGTMDADFAYAGNLIASRAGDVNALMFACSNSELSSLASTSYSSAGSTTADGSDGAIQMLRDVSGSQTWYQLPINTMGNFKLLGALDPRAPIYAGDPYRALLDDTNSIQMTACDVYQSMSRAYGDCVEGRRGEIRYLRIPCGNPSGQHLVTFGPDQDGHTFLMMRCQYPWGRVGSSDPTTDYNSSYDAMSGFAFQPGRGSSISYGEVSVVTGAPAVMIPRWFLLPIDL